MKWIGIALLIVVVAYMSPFSYVLPGYRWVYSAENYKVETKKQQENLARVLNSSAELDTISEVFVQSIDALFPYWYGTEYDFNGTSTVPGEGSIACGYFVTTVLEDLGFDISRTKLAQMGSEQMIRSLVNSSTIKIFTKSSKEDFCTWAKSQSDGIYILGLDTHTGFLRVKHGEIQFIHSSSRATSGVFKEEGCGSKSITKSKIKVVGLLSRDLVKALPLLKKSLQKND